MENRYQIAQGPDGINWVSIEPLMEDVRDNLEKLMAIDTSEFKPEDTQIIDFKVIGLRSIYEFLGALITEKNLKEIKKNMGENNDTIH